NAPLWLAGGALLLASFGVRRGHWRRWLRLALLAFPLLRRHPPRGAARSTKNDPEDSGPGHDLA
ncbi:hypothetical protein HP532_29695, partial [Pseudomonas sp. CrR25]|nr:hypothetical protein [Pseudomonas sp. CrR25]